MYGLVHQAMRDCIRGEQGDAAWDRIQASAGADEAAFVSMQAYPDVIAYSLVGAACEQLDLEAGELLRAFGHYWVLETASKHYGPILDFAGTDLATFLTNLDQMHEQVAIAFANLRQPSFELEAQPDGSHLLHYRSHRDGLSQFVWGLLEGLSQHFDQDIEISQVADKSSGADHDIFRVVIQE